MSRNQQVADLSRKQTVSITQIPWGHNIVIITNVETCLRLRTIFRIPLLTTGALCSGSPDESGLCRQNVNNFVATLPKHASSEPEVARQTQFNSPYMFDFLRTLPMTSRLSAFR